MSKRVARRYLSDISRSGRTLTVYFPSESYQRSFIASVKATAQGEDISVSVGFDSATFLSLTADAIDTVEKLAESRGFDWTDL